jgi:hypothetical protein
MNHHRPYFQIRVRTGDIDVSYALEHSEVLLSSILLVLKQALVAAGFTYVKEVVAETANGDICSSEVDDYV